MKLREKYRDTKAGDGGEQAQEEPPGGGAEGEEDDSDLVLPPPATLGSPRPSLISITEDHAVNILSQLSRDRRSSAPSNG
jgi:hypothetical protein